MSPRPRQDPLPVTFLVYDAFGGGGVAHTTANLANRLAADHPVRVISLFRWREHPQFPFDPSVEVTVLRDLRRHQHSRTGLDRLPSRLGPVRAGRNMSLLTDLLLRRTIRAVRSGVMISTRPSLHLALTAYARPGVTTIGWEHLNYPARSSRPGHAPVLRAAVPRLDAYVVLTEADAADYRGLLPDAPTHIEVIRNSVTWPLADRPPDLEQKVVVAAGRLVARKGYPRLIRAFARVVAVHPDWQLHIYGRGELRDALRAQIRRRGLESNVVVRGYTHDMPGVLRNASVYAMASHSEGFPMVLIEAMSVGLPLIAYDCPRGPGEVIRDGHNGRLIPNGRGHAFTRGLLGLVGDVELRRRMGAQALRDAESYTIDHIAGDWERLFERLRAGSTEHSVRRDRLTPPTA